MRKKFCLVTLLMMLLCSNITVSAKEKTDIGSEDFGQITADATVYASSSDIQKVTIEQTGVHYIPAETFSEDLVKNAEVIYRFTYKVTAKRYNGKTVTNMPIQSVGYSGAVKGYKMTPINSSGVGYIDIDVRGPKNFTLYCRVGNVNSNRISKTPSIKATYQQQFYCTGYNTALESDYSDSKVTAPGISGEKFRKSFLTNTKLNGSGKAESGKYLHYNSNTQQFSYISPTTATGTTPAASRTIAVDPYFIPRAKVNSIWKRATVNIEGIGQRVAEDGGGAIKGYKIDVYMGLGKAAMRNWAGNKYKVVTLVNVN